jgi:hypothetical protein
VHTLAGNTQLLLPLALAGLFAAGLYKWNRGEGTWVLILGVALAAVAVAVFVVTAGVELVTEDEDPFGEFRTFGWKQFASTVGLIAVGYFFLATRAFAEPRVPVLVRRRKRMRAKGTNDEPTGPEASGGL